MLLAPLSMVFGNMRKFQNRMCWNWHSVFVSVLYLVQSKVHPDLLQLLYTCGTAISVAVLPWIPNIWGMVAVRGIIGFCCGGQDTGRYRSVIDAVGTYLKTCHKRYCYQGL